MLRAELGLPCLSAVISAVHGRTVSRHPPAQTKPSRPLHFHRGHQTPLSGLGSPQSSTRESHPRDGASRTKPPTTRLTRPSSRDTERPEARQPGTPPRPGSGSRATSGGWIVGEGGRPVVQGGIRCLSLSATALGAGAGTWMGLGCREACRAHRAWVPPKRGQWVEGSSFHHACISEQKNLEQTVKSRFTWLESHGLCDTPTCPRPRRTCKLLNQDAHPRSPCYPPLRRNRGEKKKKLP